MKRTGELSHPTAAPTRNLIALGTAVPAIGFCSVSPERETLA